MQPSDFDTVVKQLKLNEEQIELLRMWGHILSHDCSTGASLAVYQGRPTLVFSIVTAQGQIPILMGLSPEIIKQLCEESSEEFRNLFSKPGGTQ